MTFVCNYKLMAFIFQALLWQEWRVKLWKNVVSVFSVFLRSFYILSGKKVATNNIISCINP